VLNVSAGLGALRTWLWHNDSKTPAAQKF